MEQFDVIVVGGGHAGCEAALAAARMGVEVALITMRPDDFGVMSCNPAIGGLGKGHLVREIDALDGAMGRVADRAGIQFRLLNRRKGPAVQGPRAQADRQIYQRHMTEVIVNTDHLTPIYGEVVDLVMSGERVEGIMLADESRLYGRSVILTSGTFLRGVIHLGQDTFSAGRKGNAASIRLAERIDELGLPLGRLKTGTPPRLRRQSIDWERLDSQPGDDCPTFFSFLTTSTQTPQISCGVTHTNSRTHEIIRKNIEKSAMYSGNISGKGPRYCPSIEDKVVRFADKGSHLIFLEPEGLASDLVYPNGISTSLPRHIQDDYVRSIDGLQDAEIVQHGYAIEYDFVDPRSLDRTLKVSRLDGLYLAGQINGTTGYEEAAAQGLVAGVNAALAVRSLDPWEFSRTNSYIGVMVDDLVRLGVTEPYRMFTSRAEYRLTIRADNADQRLTPEGRKLGCVRDERWAAFGRKRDELRSMKSRIQAFSMTSRELSEASIPVALDGARRDGMQVLSLNFVDTERALGLFELAEGDRGILEQLKREATYQSYADRQESEIADLKKMENLALDPEMNYCAISGLSGELSRKLTDARPRSIAEAKTIEGMTPACLLRLIGYVKREGGKRSAS